MRNVKDLHPELQRKAAQLVALCEQQGLAVKITDCVRTAEEQADCIRRGTSSVRYPHSHHNWGTAFDFCRNDGTGAYRNDDGFFQKVGSIGQSIGLEWGGSWTSPVDMPHFQLPDWGTGTAELIRLYGTPDAFRQTWVATSQPEPKPAPEPEEQKGEFATMTENEKKNFINNHLYIPYLGRTADKGGMDFWLGQITDKTNLSELVFRFQNMQESKEYAVECAYRNIFGRKSDKEGKKYWVSYLAEHSVGQMYEQMKALRKSGSK